MADDDKAALEKIQKEMQRQSDQQVASEIDAIRSKFDISDGVAQQLATGKTVTAAERKAVEQFRSQKMGDAEWVKRLLAGDAEAGKEMLLANIVLSSDVAAGEAT